MKFICLMFLLCFGIGNVSSTCSNYSTKCELVIGNQFSYDGLYDIDMEASISTYYYVKILQSTSVIQILASLIYGNIDIFASKGKEPTIVNADYSTLGNSLQDMLVLNVANYAVGTTINIMVLSRSQTKLQLTVTDPSLAIKLNLGMPFRDRTFPSGVTLFRYRPTSLTSFIVAVTPFTTGDPNLRITGPPSGTSPTATREWNSTVVGADYIVISPKAEELNHYFEIRVTSANNSDVIYTIVATESSVSNPTVLLGGYPQEDFVEKGCSRYYKLSVPKGTEEVMISLDSITGDADLYVNAPPKSFYNISNQGSVADWSSKQYGMDAVTISPSRPHFISEGGSYLITVIGSKTSKFILRGFSASTVVTLTEGMQLKGAVSSNTYRYYRFFDTNPSSDLVFDVSPITGDPDLIVGCRLSTTGNDNGFPSRVPGHYNFSSQHMDEDAVLVPYSNPKSCSKYGVFYLAIYGYATSTFTLSAMHRGGTLTLRDGLPYNDLLYKGIVAYYRFNLGLQPAELHIVLTPVYGDVDVFVKLNEVATTVDYDYISMNWDSDPDIITIPETAICSQCWVSVMVFAFQTCRYSILAYLEQTTIQLSDALPLRESAAANNVQYYQYIPSQDGSLIVVLTVFSGIPVLYISSTVTHPDGTTHNTSINNEAAFGNLPIAHFPAWRNVPIYVGVGGSSNTTYTVRVHLVADNSRITLLNILNGVQQSDYIDAVPTGWKYYQVRVQAGHDSLDIRSSSVVGESDVYVTRCPFQSFECVGGKDGKPSYLPNDTYYLQSSEGMDHDSLHVTRSDEKPYTYIIGVRSLTVYAEYLISVTLDHSVLALVPGVSVLDHVEEGESDYYSIFVDSADKVLKIKLTPMSGDPDLFVSVTTAYPSPYNFTWRSYSFGTDIISIDTYTDANACDSSCNYHITVYGYTPSTYTISASLENTLNRLMDGVPISDHVSLFTWNYYTFRNTFRDTRDILVTLSPTSGDPDMYITLDGSIPARFNYDYHVSDVPNEAKQIRILKTDDQYLPCLTKKCNIRIAVWGTLESTYVLTLASDSTATVLQEGVLVTATVRKDTYEAYKLYINKPVYIAVFTLSVQSGHVILYVSCAASSTPPSSQQYMWQMNSDSSSVLEVSSLSAEVHGCYNATTLALSVYGSTSSTYTLIATVSQNSVPLLVSGQSLSSQISFKHFDYYFVRLDGSASTSRNVHIFTTVTSGDIDLYISMTWDTRPKYSEDNGCVESYALFSGSGVTTLKQSQIVSLCQGRGSDCYIVIGIFGAYGGISSYHIVASYLEDSVTTLTSGVPIRGQIDVGQYSYYKYSQTIPSTDVLITLTPFKGDPDMVIALSPLRRPVTSNYTWASAGLGVDSLTLQSSDLSHRCIVNPDTGKNCEFYIGVYCARYTRSNCSYSLLAQMDEGFASPITLIDGQPQSGGVAKSGYSYFKFILNNNMTVTATPASSIIITLTPIDRSDQDLYVTVDGTQPSMSNYQYCSYTFSGVSDEVVIPADDIDLRRVHYVNIAVYGYQTSDDGVGKFTIVTHSRSNVEMQASVAVSGHVNGGQFVYYSYYNDDPTAIMTVSLTALSGDPDLFISCYYKRNESSVMPSMGHSQWHSYHSGSESLTIKYTDHSFCFDCEYVIGVSGYNSATYTLLVTSTEASVVQLVRNRLQVASVAAGGVRYFKMGFGSSVESVTVTMNSLDNGEADLYIRLSNISSTDPSLFPDPNNPSSYSLSSFGSLDDVLSVHSLPSYGATLLITVKAGLAATHFSLIARSVQDTVLLQAGVPQSHFVTSGVTEYFRFPLSLSAAREVQLTITARSGDPDLVVSSTQPKPYCVMDTEMFWMIECYNYTWSSKSYSTDQIIISRDFPCKSILPSTKIASTCNPNTISMDELYIGVFGFTNSKFIIMAAPLGMTIQLLAGQPQSGATSLGYLCSNRSSENGACSTDSSSTSRQAQIAYFSFRVAPEDVIPTEDNSQRKSLMVDIYPQCTQNISSSTCVPGCNCHPLVIYVSSCVASACSTLDMYPSPLPRQHQRSMMISAAGSVLFLTSSSTVKTGDDLCDPSRDGRIDGCMYYFSVLSPQIATTVVFTITAHTTSDVYLIPCYYRQSPDGIRPVVQALASTSSAESVAVHRYFEICSDGVSDLSDELVVEVEQCAGKSFMYGCEGDGSCKSHFPSTDSWKYYADSGQQCERHYSNDHLKETCQPALSSMYSPYLRLLKKRGNYFVLVNSTGEFNLRVRSGGRGGQLVAPELVRPGAVETMSALTVTSSTPSSLILSWHPTKVLMPGLTTAVSASSMRYTLYVFDVEKLKELTQRLLGHPILIFNTACGLDYLASHFSDAVHVVALPSQPNQQEEDQLLSHNIQSGLVNGRVYKFSLLATCDGDCLRQLSKVTQSAKISCSGEFDCMSQTSTYESSEEVMFHDSSNGGEGKSSSDSSLTAKVVLGLSLTIIIMMAMAMVFLAVFYYHHRNNVTQEQETQYELTEVRFSPLESELLTDHPLPMDLLPSTSMSSLSDPMISSHHNLLDRNNRKLRWDKISLFGRKPFAASPLQQQQQRFDAYEPLTITDNEGITILMGTEEIKEEEEKEEVDEEEVTIDGVNL